MWYWLEGLINSNLIEQSLLSAIWVAGFLLGFLAGSALLARTYIRYGWILIALLAAFCTKGLISLFEAWQFYTWDLMTASPRLPLLVVGLLAIYAALIYYLVKGRKSGRARYYRRY